jgi:hypothetical protein
MPPSAAAVQTLVSCFGEQQESQPKGRTLNCLPQTASHLCLVLLFQRGEAKTNPKKFDVTFAPQYTSRHRTPRSSLNLITTVEKTREETSPWRDPNATPQFWKRYVNGFPEQVADRRRSERKQPALHIENSSRLFDSKTRMSGGRSRKECPPLVPHNAITRTSSLT